MRMIVLLLLVAFLIIDGLGIWFFIYRLEKNTWKERQNEAVVNASNTISQTLRQVRSALFWLGNFGDPASLQDPVVIRTLTSQLPDLLEFVYFDRNGELLSNVSFDEVSFLGTSEQVIYTNWFLQARNNKVFIGNVQYSSTNQPFIIFSAPVFRNGNIIAVRLNAEFLREVIEGIQIGEQGKVYLLDQDGSIIVHSNPEVADDQLNIRNRPEIVNIFRTINRIWEGEYVNFEGVSVSGASMPIPESSWILIVEVPLSEIYQNTRLAAFLVIGGMVLLGLILFPIFNFWFERLFMEPLGDLISGSRRIGKGDLDYRVPDLPTAEFNDLSASINQMAADLRERDTELQIQYQTLQQEIKDRQKAEDALRILNQELERRVEERTQQLVVINENLKNEIEERERLERLYQNLVEKMPAVSYVMNLEKEFSFTFVSPQIQVLTGWDPKDWIDIEDFRLKCIHPEDVHEFVEALKRSIKNHEPFHHEYRLIHRNGDVVWVEDFASPLLNGNNMVESYQGVILDITNRKKAEAELIYNAYHDVLTGLVNRAYLVERLNQILSRRHPFSEQPLFSLLFMDLDRFKIINDSLGHRIGDQLLIEAAHRLQNNLFPTSTLARFGGDEFVILVEGEDPRRDAVQLADQILLDFQSPFLLDGKTLFTTISLGLVIDNGEYTEPDEVLRDADIAMYRAKARGRACYEVFSKPLLDQVINRHQIEALLRDALKRNEFNLYYQPIVALKDGRVVGFEALIRWITPQHGLIQPSEFISLAEETGLIHQIDRWVMHEACRQVQQWYQYGLSSFPFTVSVNLSGSLLHQGNVVQMISEILAETGISPQSLKIELTESVFLETSPSVNQQIQNIRDLGIQLQIDDFGTGYSSLSYLQRFPITAIKIDRSFISRIDAQYSGTEIVQAIITLAKELGLEIIAEGIETVSQLHWLKEAGCDYGQGYLLYRPMDAESTEKLLRNIGKGDEVM
ncbi:EAL domain-containing protein [Bellilinea caldifistulae]|uniref:EAL domain-containing protein n=1 Tax=Bellilinea caldifistulae TaxID=360411 RepID=UPI00146FC9D1|nr:EAL domain-containing protein [Bellilinea caldifistulae]